MKFKPLEHQALAIDWLKDRTEAALFAGMGLGKTASTLKALEWLFGGGESKGVLIVAPLRVAVLTWPHEVKKWSFSKGWRVANLRTKEGKKAFHSDQAEIYTINYESLPKICHQLIMDKTKAELPFDTVIFDELSAAKNPSSKRINTFRQQRFKFDRFWGLTGTPTPNSLLDLFGQIRLLDDGQRLGRAFSHYRQAFFEPENPFSDYPKFRVKPFMHEVIERKIADIALTLRSEDWLDIPPTTVEDVSVAIPAEAKKQYKELEKELLLELGDDFEVVAVNAAALATKLLQLTSGAIYDSPPPDEEGKVGEKRVEIIHTAKIEALKKLYKQEGQKPLLVAIQYKHEMERVLEELPEAESFDGEDTLTRWNRGEIPFLVAHPKSIGHGLNLQEGGSRVVWMTLSWSQELYDQFNARVARQGQTEETKIFRLIVSDTIDDAVAEALRGKEEGQSEFLATLKNIQELARSRK